MKAKSEQPFEKPDVIPELKLDANLGTPRIILSADKREATFDLPLAKRLPVGAHLAGRQAILNLTEISSTAPPLPAASCCPNC